ncbi:UPF0603 protein At1g54780, chloroplastic [Physcomitrium patens]|uniref:TPM domain-containing protein n=1 Tax=Physcomitrium patens TaxID=3218 RepID=A0A2K1JVC8_PHYPA|nr:UPF0603 protein Os05g0401100, chloroplastic-like [Physcomitrium patens]PNR45475.1 hypothetical protein PHYPA_015246 [Physcomitrium patens]|eukprot:XP_024388522.1 UPF0603 protein Os05g0401100, chloroplastic-like [Physcomitrella patens]
MAMMAEVMARGSSTLLGSASSVVVPCKKAPATPFLGASLPSLSTGARKNKPQCNLAVSATKASLSDALSKAKSTVGTGLAALALSAAMNLCPAVPYSEASEFNVLNEGPPTENFVVDDANVLNRVTKSDIKRLLRDLEERKGYHINVITLRKLTSKADSFEFADAVLEKWYPTLEEGNNKGIVLLVTTQKEGAVTGGPAFTKAVGDKVLEAVTAENLPVLATDEKYNEAIYSTTKRLVAAIDGLEDIGGPSFKENKRESNFKSKEETESKRGQFSLVVGGLLVIAFVVPMAQYYAYVSKK